MGNFNLKKFMVENKLTAISRLVNEDATSKIEAEIEKVANSPVTDDAPTKDEKTALAAEIIYDKYRMAGDEDRAEIAKSIMRAHMNEAEGGLNEAVSTTTVQELIQELEKYGPSDTINFALHIDNGRDETFIETATHHIRKTDKGVQFTVEGDAADISDF